MALPRRETNRPPSHPGAVVRLELEELGLSVTEAARRLHVSRRTLSELWLAMQMTHDHWRVEHDEDSAHPAMATADKARLCWGMDAEMKAYLDGMLAEILKAMNAGFSRLEQRMEALEQRVEALEQRVGALEQRVGAMDRRLDGMELRFEERFISLEERLRTMELRMEQFEARVTDRLDTMDRRLHGMERRLEEVEKHLLGVHARVDDLAGDMRQRFRVLNDRVGGIERRLVA